MPSPLAIQSATGPFREGVDVFGDAERNQPTRVEVRFTMCLSFADLLGLLAFTPSLVLEYEELDDDEAVRDAVRIAMAMRELATRDAERTAQDALAAYHGTLHGHDVPPVAYMRRVGLAITRVFGVTA
ncbi:hypothetical protein ACFXDF_26030 [Streptomyces sp. NPDC059426]|uniref:hypothetical protein n=1 Tax=Streptomyces sp. NPDC059426 TaxID=3346827 RepID=UPI0036C4FE3B